MGLVLEAEEMTKYSPCPAAPDALHAGHWYSMLLLLAAHTHTHTHTHRIAVFAVSTTFSAMGIAILFKRTTPFSMENFVANDTTPLAWAII